MVDAADAPLQPPALDTRPGRGGRFGEEAREGQDALLGDLLLDPRGHEGHDDDVAQDGECKEPFHYAFRGCALGAKDALEKQGGDVARAVVVGSCDFLEPR